MLCGAFNFSGSQRVSEVDLFWLAFSWTLIVSFKVVVSYSQSKMAPSSFCVSMVIASLLSHGFSLEPDQKKKKNDLGLK